MLSCGRTALKELSGAKILGNSCSLPGLARQVAFIRSGCFHKYSCRNTTEFNWSPAQASQTITWAGDHTFLSSQIQAPTFSSLPITLQTLLI